MFVGSSAFLSNSNLSTVITLNSTALMTSSKITLLGVNLDSNFNFSHSISYPIQRFALHMKRVHNTLLLTTAIFSQSSQSSQELIISTHFSVVFQPMFFLSCNLFKTMLPKLFFKMTTAVLFAPALIAYTGHTLPKGLTSNGCGL